jgi:DNA topoisomerase-3
MKRFADSLVRQKGIKPPPGYKTSIAICRKFLNEHAPKKADGKADGEAVETGDARSVSPAQLSYATKIAIGKGVVIPDEAKADAAAMSTWIDQNRPSRRRNAGRKTVSKRARSTAPRSTAPKTRPPKRKAAAAASPPAQTESATETPLRIPYGNKDIAVRLGARYRPGGWYAPPGIDLAAFGERGWL